MKRPQSLTAKLKNAEPEIKNYTEELEKENLRLQKQVAKLQVQVVSLQHEITAVKQAQPKLTVNIQKFAAEKDVAVTEVFAQASEQLKKAKAHKTT